MRLHFQPLEDLFAESIGIAIKNCESRPKKDDSFSQNNNSFSVDVVCMSLFVSYRVVMFTLFTILNESHFMCVLKVSDGTLLCIC